MKTLFFSLLCLLCITAPAQTWVGGVASSHGIGPEFVLSSDDERGFFGTTSALTPNLQTLNLIAAGGWQGDRFGTNDIFQVQFRLGVRAEANTQPRVFERKFGIYGHALVGMNWYLSDDIRISFGLTPSFTLRQVFITKAQAGIQLNLY